MDFRTFVNVFFLVDYAHSITEIGLESENYKNEDANVLGWIINKNNESVFLVTHIEPIEHKIAYGYLLNVYGKKWDELDLADLAFSGDDFLTYYYTDKPVTVKQLMLSSFRGFYE